MKKQLQTGFAHLGLLLLLLVAVVVALAGYKVAKNHSNTVTSSSTAPAARQVQTIKSTADLNKAQSTLSSENVDGDLNPDSMNQDVQSLL